MSAHLAHINRREAARKWREGLPCSLKEMAVALGVSYGSALAWSKRDKFPLLEKRVFRGDFEMWRRQQLGLPVSLRECGLHTEERQTRSGADKCGAPREKSGLPASLPPKAVRLLSPGSSRK